MRMSMLFTQVLRERSPLAIAHIRGNQTHTRLSGSVKFYRTPLKGILIEAEITGLPQDSPTGFFAMHIHESGDCTPPFDKTGMHYNPQDKPHPEHAGDLLPLPGNRGAAWYVFYDERLTVEEIIGRSVIIHANRDDFTTQPSGDAGEKIGCGTIIKVRR